MNLEERIKQAVEVVQDFPAPGVAFKDITTLFLAPGLCREILDEMVRQYREQRVDAIIGLESRGFMFGFSLALELDVPFILVRKKGKLPRATYGVSYALEYGQAEIEMHRDALHPGQRVLIHDDLLATGGTAAAAAALVGQAGAEVAAFSFLIEIPGLGGRKILSSFGSPISTFATY